MRKANPDRIPADRDPTNLVYGESWHFTKVLVRSKSCLLTSTPSAIVATILLTENESGSQFNVGLAFQLNVGLLKYSFVQYFKVLPSCVAPKQVHSPPSVGSIAQKRLRCLHVQFFNTPSGCSVLPSFLFYQLGNVLFAQMRLIPMVLQNQYTVLT